MATRTRRIPQQPVETITPDVVEQTEELSVEVPIVEQTEELPIIEQQDVAELPIAIEEFIIDQVETIPVEPESEPEQMQLTGEMYRHIQVNIVKITTDAIIPKQMFNEGCFDIQANFTNVPRVLVVKNDVSRDNRQVTTIDLKNRFRGITLESNECVLIPTNLLFILPINCKMHIYGKNNLSFNNGIKLVNGVDIIHSSYVDPLFIALKNESSMRKVIKQGDVIAQGEIMPYFIADFNLI